MYHIQIVGAGYAGSRIAAYFREKKQKVWALTRSGKRNAEFEALGITPIVADLTKPETLQNIPPAQFIVICPAPGEARDEAAYREIYLQGIGNYLEASRRNPKPNLIVYLSSTGVYRDRGGEWVDESTPPEPDTEKGKILLEAENQVLNSGFPAVVFRLAGIYGPGRTGNVIPAKAGIQFKMDPRLKSATKMADPSDLFGGHSGMTLPPDKPSRWTNHIHVDDIVGAMPVLFNKAEPGQVYLGVDDEPVLQKGTGTGMVGKRCSNAKLKALGYEFKYPTFRIS